MTTSPNDDWRFLEIQRGTPCRFFDMDEKRWVPATVIRWLPGKFRSVTVEVGEGVGAIRYTVGKSRIRLLSSV